MLNLLRRLESRALILLIAAAAAVWAFLGIAGEMAEGETLAIDRRILLMLRTPGNLSDPIGPPSLEEAMRDLTALGGFTVLTIVTVVGTAAFLLHRKRLHAAILAGTVLISQFLSEQLKTLYGRPRPDLVPHGSYVYSASFPSGHSMLSAATYLTLAMLIASLEPRRATKALVFGLAVVLMIAVGFSRIYLGVHWPSDVLAGWCAGAAAAFAAWMVLLRLDRRATTVKP
ncbi:phosphatase PAP2 family protein [Phenylobacterium hankyongense]|nr:phosphatase PAP2 family protein [Phenylobacterium hankyongense]